MKSILKLTETILDVFGVKHIQYVYLSVLIMFAVIFFDASHTPALSHPTTPWLSTIIIMVEENNKIMYFLTHGKDIP